MRVTGNRFFQAQQRNINDMATNRLKGFRSKAGHKLPLILLEQDFP